jgi:phospholipase/carboxylesterase
MPLVVREAGEQHHPRMLLVLLHGRGSDEQDLLSLAGYFNEGARVVSVRAPYRYGSGYAWYTFTDAARPRLAEWAASVQELTQWIDSAHNGLPVVLLGFSQGGQIAQAVAVQRAGQPVRALVSLSAPPLFELPPGQPLKGLPAFWGHGTTDPVVSPERGEETLSLLVKLGASVLPRRYAMGHSVTPEEISDIQTFLAQAAKNFAE